GAGGGGGGGRGFGGGGGGGGGVGFPLPAVNRRWSSIRAAYSPWSAALMASMYSARTGLTSPTASSGHTVGSLPLSRSQTLASIRAQRPLPFRNGWIDTDWWWSRAACSISGMSVQYFTLSSRS